MKMMAFFRPEDPSGPNYSHQKNAINKLFIHNIQVCNVYFKINQAGECRMNDATESFKPL